MFKNKKASAEVYLFILVIVTLLVLGTLSYLIQKNNSSNRTEVVGLSSVTLVKAYDEGEKVKLYLAQSLKLAESDTIAKLKENGGYEDETNCQINKLTKETTQLINNCPDLDIENSFSNQLKKELKKYANQYKSSYTKTELDQGIVTEIYEFFSEPVVMDISKLYEKSLSLAEVKEIQISPELTLKFNPIIIPVEYNPSSHYIISPVLKAKSPRLKDFETLHTILRTCLRIKDTYDGCKSKILTNFPNAQIEQDGLILIVNADGIKLAVRLQP